MTRPIAEQEEQDRLHELGLKRCSKCRENKPLSEFKSRPKNRDGLEGQCKQCRHDQTMKWIENNPERAKENNRRHSHSEKRKAYLKEYRQKNSEYLKQKRHDDYLKDKEHQLQLGREYYQENKERVLSRIKVYRQTAKDKRRETNKTWLKAHPEKRREFKKRYRANHWEKVSAYERAKSKEYRKTHRREMAHRQARRRALVRNAPGTHDVDQWEKLVELCGNKCVACDDHKDKPTCDHIIPLSWGGSDSLDNVQPLCLRCNAKKQDLYAADYRPLPARAWSFEQTYGTLDEEMDEQATLEWWVKVQAVGMGAEAEPLKWNPHLTGGPADELCSITPKYTSDEWKRMTEGNWTEFDEQG